MKIIEEAIKKWYKGIEDDLVKTISECLGISKEAVTIGYKTFGVNAFEGIEAKELICSNCVKPNEKNIVVYYKGKIVLAKRYIFK